MSNKFKIISAYIMICIIGLSSVLYAKTTSTYDYELYTKYKIVTDGQSVTVPTSTTFLDDYSVDLTQYHSTLTKLANSSNKIEFVDSKLSFSGVFVTTFFDEYKAIVNLTGEAKTTPDYELLKKYDLVKHFLPNKQSSLVKYKNEKNAEGTAADRIKILDTLIANYEEDIEELTALKTQVNALESRQSVLVGVPYLVKRVSTKQQVNATQQTVKEENTIKYYLYTTIYRDLRLDELKYSVNSGASTAVTNFNEDTYTYDVTLPVTTPRDAKIKTTSALSMMSTIDASDYKGTDLGLSVKEADITLNNGKGTAKVVVTFDISKYKPNDDYTSNITREYTINFKVADYKKGDINRDGLVDSADAAIALNIYKYNNATEDNILMGDMDDNGMIDSADAAIILNVFKYNL